MEQPEDNNVDQPVSEVDDVQATEAPAEDAPAEQRADEEVEQQPTADADELAARAGGPDAAEEVPAVVEQEVVEEKEEGGFEAQQPEEPAAVEEVEQPSDETPESEETAPEPLAANEPEEQQLVSEPEEVADTDPAAAPLGEVDTGSSLTGDAEERAIPEPASASAPIEVEPELAAAVEEAFEEVEGEEGEPEPEYLPGEWYVVHTYAGYENKEIGRAHV